MTGLLENVWLLSVVITCATAVPRRLKEGETCVSDMFENQKGVCKPYKACPLSEENMEKYGVPPDLCSTVKGETIVCCIGQENVEKPEDTRTTTTTSTTARPTTTTAYSRPHLFSGKSQIKCQEYSEWDTPHTLTVISIKTAGPCGIANEQLIFGGKRADPMEFPHMAHLGFLKADEIAYECGGSLISEQFILTAAHCVQDKYGNDLSHAKLGAGSNASTIVVKISEIIPHPDYTSDAQYNDIALLKLETRLTQFNKYMRPACLQSTKNIDRQYGTASGWGATEDADMSEELLKVGLPFINYSNCTKSYRPQYRLLTGLDDETMLCAGGIELKKDTCQGDSGGPLQIVLKVPTCMYSIVGVTAFGSACGRVPGVYTRVSYYLPWIESVVWPD